MPPKKEEKKTDLVAEVGFILLILLMLWMLWSSILGYIQSRIGSFGSLWQAFVAKFMTLIYPSLMMVAVILSIILAWGIVRTFRKLSQLNREQEEKYGSTEVSLLPSKTEERKEEESKKNDRWEHAMSHLNSASAGEWRLAIIEADVMLDEMLRTLGYHGDSIGEMLKGVDKSEMLTLENAWEAHKVRNQIVHAGSDYYLTEREAKRIMNLYESVFREFRII